MEGTRSQGRKRSLSQRRQHRTLANLGLAAIIVVSVLLAACGTDARNTDTADSDTSDGGDQDGAHSYEGETLRLVVPRPPGGSVDLVGRLYAQELPKYIPGSPSIVVENIDGGGGAVGMLEVAERSEADGLSIVVASTGILLRWLLEEEGHTYNLDRMPILGALPSNRVVAARADAAGTIQDAVDAEEPLPFGATTTSSGMGLFGALSSSLLGMNVDMIYGFDGEADGVLAFERGELALFSPNDSIYLTQFVDMDAIPLYQSGVQTEEGNFERSELTPDIPTFEEVYQEMMGEDPAGEEWDALTAVIAAEAGHTSVFVHEDTPEGQVEVLQSAFRDMIEDSDWPAATESAVGEAMAGIGPERARSVVDDLAGLSDEARALLQSVAEGNG